MGRTIAACALMVPLGGWGHLGIPAPRPEDPNVFLVRQIDRERIIASLVTKAAETKRGIVALAEANFATDAYTLCRVLLENLIVLWWLTPENVEARNLRIDTYVLHAHAVEVHIDEVERAQSRAHGAEAPQAYSTERTRGIASDLFDDKWVSWAWMPVADGTGARRLVKLREMAEEVGLAEIYQRDYLNMSLFVHSASMSVWDVTDGSDYFSVQPMPASGYDFKALLLANLFMWGIVFRINARFGFGLDEKLAVIASLLWPEPAASGAGGGR